MGEIGGEKALKRLADLGILKESQVLNKSETI